MAQYDSFAAFYDAVNGEPTELIATLLGAFDRYRPDARDVLELGCGTGAVLAGLGSGYSLTGIDLSSRMLERARRRCPEARLLEADITRFELDETFDAVICVFDTLNHVTSLEGWETVVSKVAQHLRDGGLFFFDLNTVGRLRDLGDMAPWVYDFDGHTLVMDVNFSREPLAVWDIRIFEHRSDDNYVLHRDTIFELGVDLETVRQMLSAHFEILEEFDEEGSPASDDSVRAIVVARRRPR